MILDSLRQTGGVPLENQYLPYPVRIDKIIIETEDRNLKTFSFVFINHEDEEKFSYIPGQFAELSIAGKGEIPIGIASSPTEKGVVTFTVNKVGLETGILGMRWKERMWSLLAGVLRSPPYDPASFICSTQIIDQNLEILRSFMVPGTLECSFIRTNLLNGSKGMTSTCISP